MGPQRSHPLMDKNIEFGSNDQISYAACGVQGNCNQYYFKIELGWRTSMEDTHIADINLGNDRYIFGVFDGHGGYDPSLILLKLISF